MEVVSAPTAAGVLYYEETIRNPGATMMKIAVPASTLVTVILLVPILHAAGMSVSVVIGLAVVVIVADIVALAVILQRGPPPTHRVSVTANGIHWERRPGHQAIIRFGEIDEMRSVVVSGRPHVFVDYSPAETSARRTARIPTANSFELITAVEWVRLGE